MAMIKFDDNVYVFDHPLIKHKISILRDKNTGTNEFRSIVEELAMLMGYEALSDLPTRLEDIETPICKCKSPVLDGRKLAIVPILRAGLGMVPGMLALVPSAKVGHIGMYRDEKTLKHITLDFTEFRVNSINPLISHNCSSSESLNSILVFSLNIAI